jgi:hypothetical protein
MARTLALLVGVLLLLAVPQAAAQGQDMPRAAAAGLAAAGQHTCAILDDRRGLVACWGRLPGGPGTPSAVAPLPVLRSGVEGATLIASGTDHDCALLGFEGPVACWGDDTFGQLGGLPPAGEGGEGEPEAAGEGGAAADDASAMDEGDAFGSGRSGALSRVEVGSDVIELVAGDEHSCLLGGEGRVSCWGRGDSGQLGDGGRSDRREPAEVVRRSGRPLAPVTSVAAGADHTCASLRDGRVLCWGGGPDGPPHPRRVADVPRVDMLAAGLGWTCGALFPGEPWCWDTAGGSPAPVEGAPALMALAGNAGLACGIDEEFRVWCWQPTGGAASMVPASDAAGFLAVGDGHACLSRADDGTVRCWGPGELGQIGDGTLRDSAVPVEVQIGAALVPPPSPAPLVSPEGATASPLPAVSASPDASPDPSPRPSPPRKP